MPCIQSPSVLSLLFGRLRNLAKAGKGACVMAFQSFGLIERAYLCQLSPMGQPSGVDGPFQQKGIPLGQAHSAVRV